MLRMFPEELETNHRQATGWYSHTVLAAALDETQPPMWKLCASRASQQDWQQLAKEDYILGALVNLHNSHWTCVCKESGHVFYCDSKYAPVLFFESDWHRVLQLHIDTFLVVRHDCDAFF